MINCEECAFWIPQKDNPDYGECRVHAPSPIVKPTGGRRDPEQFATVWPYTRTIDGCEEGVRGAKPKVPEQDDTPSQAMTKVESVFNKAVQDKKTPELNFNDLVQKLNKKDTNARDPMG